ncbi:[protein-PII] uridylyltransferase [Thermithiobacillus plumbiphilus]|uniref:Bifunctional uridylyltransferase/uridylyl-removing enzyme n=1 Tax=Thermithiobacillus plumbiphilus TaxID=1729899 RepID=A0ABU9D3M0_9PROT
MSFRIDRAQLLQKQAFQRQLRSLGKAGDPGVILPGFAQLCRDYLEQGRLRLQTAYQMGASGTQLVHGQRLLMDYLLEQIWRLLPRFSAQGPAPDLALVAVGGYGRGELLPHSDVDLLFLVGSEAVDSATQAFIEAFVTFLWDVRLEVGHSVRTIQDCLDTAADDITIITSLLEARFLSGSQPAFSALQHAIRDNNPWSDAAFYEAKLAEQAVRHARFGDTAYNLEPNIKEGPGALRDLQVVEWVARRHFACIDLRCAMHAGYITPREYATLMNARNFLWRLRAGLHYAAGRREDRLLFDYQALLASDLGYRDTAESLGIEKLMKRYFRTLKEVSVLTEMLLQSLGEDILPPLPENARQLDEHFEIRQGHLRVIDLATFQREPHTMLTLFQHLQQQDSQVRIGPRTLRALRASVSRINHQFRDDPRNQATFMQMLRHGQGLTRILRQMNAYGILGAYIPAFGRIVGQMQHDLFHVYTVDQHTLFLVRNLRRFSVPEFADELPLCSEIYAGLEKPELLIIAGLFHDIAKGRGGDHSTLGAEDAQRFCQRHGLSRDDTALVSWLVRQHLIMSSVSQRRDIEDPEVIREFTQQVGSQRYLDHLYLLTVADIRATNPDLWNSWKDQLLRDLYHASSAAFQRRGNLPAQGEELVRYRQSHALGLLPEQAESLAQRHWERLGDAYFFRYEPQEIAWHTEAIVGSHSLDLPLVRTRLHPQQAGTEILIYMPNVAGGFARITGALDSLGLNVIDARLDITPDGFSLDTIRVLDGDDGCIDDPAALTEMAAMIGNALRGKPLKKAPVWRIRRRRRAMQSFHTPVEIHFDSNALSSYTLMEVFAPDRQGLLHEIAQVLQTFQVQVQGAKIATFGERVEDTFFLVDKDGCKLQAGILPALEAQLVSSLSPEPVTHA